LRFRYRNGALYPSVFAHSSFTSIPTKVRLFAVFFWAFSPEDAH
jgi:hypothetical protein